MNPEPERGQEQPRDKPRDKPRSDKPKGEHPALQQIREAMERGEFDNLPGKGKPLPPEVLSTDPRSIASGIRRNANLGTPWEELAREIDALTRRATHDLHIAHQARQRALQQPKANVAQIETSWSRSVANFEARVAQINSRILTFNLLLPRTLPHLHRARLHAESLAKETTDKQR